MLAWSAARFPVKDLLRTSDLPRVSGSDCGTSTYVLVRPDKLDQQAVVEPVVPRLTADKWRINSTSTLRAEYRAPSRRRVLGSSYGRPLAAISDHPASRLRHMTRSHQRSRGRPSRAVRSAPRITSARHPTMPQPDARPRSRLQRTIERRKKAHAPVACRAEPVFQASSSLAPDLACR
jgi:hypothetical protein